MNKNIFRFKQFNLKQESTVFKIGTDGVLLGCLANIFKAKSLLDIGTGTGIISLICAQKNPSIIITAIDSEEDAYKLAEENCNNSPFSKNITTIHSDLNTFNSKKVFDYIICNPPYFKTTKQLHIQHPIARHQLKLNYTDLIKTSNSLLSNEGKIGYIFPIENEREILNTSKNYSLFPERIIHIQGIKNGKVKRVFLELSKEEKETSFHKFHIEESPRKWSEEYKKLTFDFYL